MKNKFLLLVFITLFSSAYAQTSLREVIRGDKGVSKHFVSLPANRQVSFSPATAKSIFNLDAYSDYVLTKSTTSKTGLTMYRFYQTYKNVPVEGSMYIVHTKNGKLVNMSGEIITDFSQPAAKKSIPAISGKDAVAAAMKTVQAQKYIWQDAAMEASLKEQTGNTAATYTPEAKLVWYAPGESINPAALRLSYKINIYASEPLSRANYFIDAQTGTLLGKKDLIHAADTLCRARTVYSGIRYIDCYYKEGQFSLRDLTRGNGIITVDKKGDNYTSTSPFWILDFPDRNAIDAHWGIEKTYDFYKENFNRNSIDDAGFRLKSFVNETGLFAQSNAFWDGEAMHYGKIYGTKQGLTAIDITGHELTHGFTQNEAGLEYSFESGAINESFSDIMGKSVQFFAKPEDSSWVLSNDLVSLLFRDMSNPNAYSQPDTYKGTFWYAGSGDNGGVHYNSGVGNFMFYLLVTGGTGTNDKGDNYAVSPLGLAVADQILYRSNTDYLFPTSQYTDFRAGCINAATDLYGAASNEVAQVMNAFYAVGIGPAAPVSSIVKQTEIAALSILPNPVLSSTAQISYQLLHAGNAVIKINHLNTGRTMQSIMLGNQKPGKYNYTLQTTAALPAGNYALSVEQNGVLVSRTKFMVVK